MAQKVADDYVAIAKRLAEIEADKIEHMNEPAIPVFPTPGMAGSDPAATTWAQVRPPELKQQSNEHGLN